MFNFKKWIIEKSPESYLGKEGFRICKKLTPFDSFSKNYAHKEEAKENLRNLNALDTVLLLFFVFNSILLIVTAIFAPNITMTMFYSLWECAQLAFLFFLAYHFSHLGSKEDERP